VIDLVFSERTITVVVRRRTLCLAYVGSLGHVQSDGGSWYDVCVWLVVTVAVLRLVYCLGTV